MTNKKSERIIYSEANSRPEGGGDMYCNVTDRIRAGMERTWEEAAVCGYLSNAATIIEYLNVLRDHQKWSSLSFCLRRYIYLRFAGRSSEEEPVGYTVEFDGRVYVFSPVSPDVELSEQEKTEYAELLYRITLSNRCFAKDKRGMVDSKKGAISKQRYLNYLNDHYIYRENLFPLSVALGFDVEEMTRFMNVLGESPVYNFRSWEECIYYFCHSVPELNNWDTVEELTERYRAIRRTALRTLPEGAGMTERLRGDLDDIVYDEELSDLERKEAFLSFLEENVSQFVRYSRSARDLLAKELNSEFLLDTRKTRESSGSSKKVEEAFVHPDEVECELEDQPGVLGSGLYEDLFSSQYKQKYSETLKIRLLDLDSRLTGHLTDGAHLRSVFSEDDGPAALQEWVRKQDFLLIRLLKFSDLIQQNRYTNQERLELMRRFRRSTDCILSLAGLPMIYVANPMDHMVLTALCQKDPAKFTNELYFHAVKERAP